MGRKNYNFNAFTLVELLIVVSILAILVVISVMYFRGQFFKGNDAKRKADINRIKVAVEEYEKDHNCYPPPQLVVCTNGGTGLRPYLDRVPCDPSTNGSYFYDYQNSACPSWYQIYTKLEFSQDSEITLNIGPGGLYNYYSGSSNAPIPTSSNPTGNSSSGGSVISGSVTGYWGCIGGSCQPVKVSAPGQPICNPTYTQSNCNNDCGSSLHNCIPL